VGAVVEAVRVRIRRGRRGQRVVAGVHQLHLLRAAAAWLVVARSNLTVLRLGSGPIETFPLLSIATGVSSIHSAVA